MEPRLPPADGQSPGVGKVWVQGPQLVIPSVVDMPHAPHSIHFSYVEQKKTCIKKDNYEVNVGCFIVWRLTSLLIFFSHKETSLYTACSVLRVFEHKM